MHHVPIKIRCAENPREGSLGLRLVRSLTRQLDGEFEISQHPQGGTRARLSFEEVNDKVWDLPADVFIPAAASKIITRDQIERLIKAGLVVMSCGANVPFSDDDFLFGPTAEISEIVWTFCRPVADFVRKNKKL
mgnify:CR=1 FL=1